MNIRRANQPRVNTLDYWGLRHLWGRWGGTHQQTAVRLTQARLEAVKRLAHTLMAGRRSRTSCTKASARTQPLAQLAKCCGELRQLMIRIETARLRQEPQSCRGG